MSHQNKTTPIDMLPNLEDIESRHQHQMSGDPNRFDQINDKYIRTNYRPTDERSGMINHTNMNSMAIKQKGNQNFHNNQSYDQQDLYETSYGEHPYKGTHNTPYKEHFEEGNSKIKTYNMPSDSPSCLSVAEHIANCPICSKFYNSW